MFPDLDDTLRAVLNDPDAPTELLNADVSFETPDNNFEPAEPIVNLFLYEVKENRGRRDPTPVVERVGTTFVRRPAPARLDCTYLVTAWSRNVVGAARAVAAEHLLLSQALVWLSRFPTLAVRHLQGGLTTQPFPVPTEVAQMQEDHTGGAHFWTALGTAPRPAFNLTATIALEVGVAVGGPLVTTRLTDVNAETWAQVGGRVRTAAGVGIPNTVVEILDAGLQTRSDVDGRWSFDRVPLGAHSLRASAVGFARKTQTFVVPGRSEDYEVELLPV